MAMLAAEALVEAYQNGKARGGSMEWHEVDDAHVFALAAVKAGGQHDADEDCALDPNTGTCVDCGVWHGDPCFDCKARAYHREGCPVLEEEGESDA